MGEAHRGEPRGVLRLTSSVSFARAHLAPAIAEYMQLFPETGFDLILSDRTLNMVDEGIDLAFRITHAVDPGLVARPLAPCRVPKVRSFLDYFAERVGDPPHWDRGWSEG